MNILGLARASVTLGAAVMAYLAIGFYEMNEQYLSGLCSASLLAFAFLSYHSGE